MLRSAVSLVVGVLLAVLAGGGVAAASPPAPPQITDVDVVWDLRQWDDGTVRCTSMVDVWFEPAFTRGQPLFAQATWSYRGEWQVMTGAWPVQRGEAKAHLYGAYHLDGPFLADSLTVLLMTHKGTVLDSQSVPTTNTCPTS